jgi:hypothetical protein
LKALRILKKTVLYAFLAFVVLLSLGIGLTYLFEDKLIAMTLEEMNKHLKAKIEVDKKIDLSIISKFPQISLRFKDVKIFEAVEGSEDKLGEIKELYFAFDAIDFINGKYVISDLYLSDGSVKLYIDKKGKNNFNILKEDTASQKSKVSFDLKKIILENISIDYTNELTDQQYSGFSRGIQARLNYNENQWRIGLNGNLLVHKIRIAENEYLRDKEVKLSSTLQLDQAEKVFQILPSDLTIEKSEYQISGSCQFKNKNTVDLNITGKKGQIATLLSVLPKSMYENLSRYKSAGQIYFNGRINGYVTERENPFINIDFGFENTSFSHPDLEEKIEHAYLSGNFTNGDKHNASSSALSLKDIKCSLGGKEFQANFLIKNFKDPFTIFDIKGQLNAASLLNFYPVEPLKNAEGIIDINARFSGRLADLKTNEGKERINATGELRFTALGFELQNKPFAFRNLQGVFNFNKNDLIINEFKGKAGKSDFQFNGSLKNVFSKLIYNKGILTATGDLRASLLNLEELLSSIPEKKDVSPGITPLDEPDPNNPYPHMKGYAFKFNCDIKHLHFKKMHATDITASIHFDQPSAKIDMSSLQLAGGKIQLNSVINFSSSRRIEFNTKGSLKHISIDSVFYISDNFDQQFITDKNLKGQFTGNLQLFFIMNKDLHIDPASVIANIEASILNGQLINFEPMKKLSRFVNEKELEHIRFSELKNNIYIENQKISIPEMLIKSNVTTISISGTHTFDQVMDYKLALPLKNLNKSHKDKDEAYGAIEEDEKGNTVVHLTIKGTSENYKVAYDAKRTGAKIKGDLKKEKKELQNIFKQKEDAQKSRELNKEEYFDFD